MPSPLKSLTVQFWILTVPALFTFTPFSPVPSPTRLRPRRMIVSVAPALIVIASTAEEGQRRLRSERGAGSGQVGDAQRLPWRTGFGMLVLRGEPPGEFAAAVAGSRLRLPQIGRAHA